MTKRASFALVFVATGVVTVAACSSSSSTDASPGAAGPTGTGAGGTGGNGAAAGGTSSHGGTGTGGTSAGGGANTGGSAHAGTSNAGGGPGAGGTGAGGTSAGGAGTGGTSAGGAGGGSGASSVQGRVVDISGNPVANAVVSGGGAMATTAADGTFSLPATPGDLLVTTHPSGFLLNSKHVNIRSGIASVASLTVAPVSPALPLDADQGGTVVGPRGATLVAPPGAFVDAKTGAAVTGPITVALTPLDPGVIAELAAYPGALVAKKLDGTFVTLGTLGVVDVDAEQNGQRLTVKPGMTLTLAIPGTKVVTSPPSAELWSYDETSGLWSEEAPIVYDAATQSFTAELPDLSVFNADLGVPTGCFKTHVLDANHNPVPGASVLATNVEVTNPDQVSLPICSSGGTTGLLGEITLGGVAGLQLAVDVITSNWGVNKSFHVQNGSTMPGAGSSPDMGKVFFSDDDPACLMVPDLILDGTGGAGGTGAGGTGSAGSSTAGSCFPPSSTGGAGGSGGDAGAGGSGGAANPFAGTCVDGIQVPFQCMGDLSGTCTSKLGPNMTFEQDYPNGAKIVWMGSGGLSSGTMKAPDGTVCGAINGSAMSAAIVDEQNSKVWTIFDNGSMITCPDGTTVTLTTDQKAALDGCHSIIGGGGPGSGCQMTTPGSCTIDSDCSNLQPGLICCMTKGGNMCEKDQSSCASIQALACANTADCTGTSVCCKASATIPITLCLPMAACM